MEFPKCQTPGCDFTSCVRSPSNKWLCSLCWSRWWMSLQVVTNKIVSDFQPQLSLNLEYSSEESQNAPTHTT